MATAKEKMVVLEKANAALVDALLSARIHIDSFGGEKPTPQAQRVLTKIDKALAANPT